MAVFPGMKKPAGVSLLIAIVVCVGVRTARSGWGLIAPLTQPAGLVPFGIAANPSDYLTYSSWAQQARVGAWTFSDLYTTTEHTPAYFNPFFLVVGWLSRACAVPPELIMNLSVFLSLCIFIYALNFLCGRLRFSGLTTFCVVFLCFGGGGVTWLRWLVELVGLRGTLRTVGPADALFSYPDWYYAELFPALTFNVSPFHSMALALMALIVALLFRYGNPSEPFRLRDATFLILTSAFLVGMRPYEPVVVLAASGVYLCLVAISVSTQARVKRTAALFGCLCVGIIPFLAYDAWLTRQPVWREFSKKGLDLFGSADWAGAFLVLWVLAIAAVTILRWRALREPYAFLVIWSSIYAAVLVVLHSGLTKLCGGCTIPLSLLAGVALEEFGQRLRSRSQKVIAAAVIACLAFGSPALMLFRTARFTPYVDSDLFFAIDAIRRSSNNSRPVILTDESTAMYLPGFAGFRVYCGNWGLTDDYDRKVTALATIGLSAAPASSRELPQSSAAMACLSDLAGQIQNGVFSYLVISGDAAAPQVQRLRDEICRDSPNCAVYKGTKFCAIRLDRGIIDKVTALIRPVSG